MASLPNDLTPCFLFKAPVLMAIMSKPSAAPHTSLTFITLGVVMAIPSAAWYLMFNPHDLARFVCVSLFFLGMAFLTIGFSVGYIGRAARQAELPPSEVTGAVARQDQAIVNRGMTPTTAIPTMQPVNGATTYSRTI